MKGHVNVYKNDKLVVDKDNHIVVAGRHYLMQRLFGLPYSIEDQQQDWLPRWFAIGNGGASLDTPFQPIWPADEDTDVYSILNINPSGGSRYTDDKQRKLIDSATWSSSLTAKLTMTLDYDDAVDQFVNEAGLFASPSELSTETDFAMFSHVTFPTLPKSNLDRLVVEWFFIF